ncbi:hypothetical protein Thiowin_02553 [Thiorhodovibrio winogradskyi]|uniref:DUF302 domain-containing protein n=1 Tax=Thiorhodovibrio winogradskyi TaxID=77007 RepID=A0ABZ0S8Y4_9GAMM|nr:DUF302 domain-containing protein [Thiorhodovibrio winogradskyi]
MIQSNAQLTRQALLVLLLMLAVSPATFSAEQGLAQRTSPYSIPDTLDRLEALLQEKGVTVFARIDHSAGAQEAGLELPPMQLLIFGHPKAGTPLMRAAPSSGLDLPLKVLVWEDADGQGRLPAFQVGRFAHEAFIPFLGACSR